LQADSDIRVRAAESSREL